MNIIENIVFFKYCKKKKKLRKTENKRVRNWCSVVVVINTMSQHKCSANGCPRAVINGPKIKCCKCENICYLQCYGFEAGAKVDGLETVKITSNGSVFTTYLSTMAFSCCTQTLSPNEQKSALKLPSASRSSSKTRAQKPSESEQKIANELSSIKEMLTSLKNATDANTVEIAAIKSLSTETEANVKKVTEQNATTQFSTPMAPAAAYVHNFRTRSYARAVAGTPKSTKRPRSKSPVREKSQFPEAKVGKKSNVNGLQVVPKVVRNRDVNPIFAKALYVSRLNPATTNEALSDYIVENTSVKDKTKFKVYKMIKKGVDESTLKFVSFKVEMNEEELEVLDDASLWPEGVLVREFQQVPKNELGRHFPGLPPKDTPNATDHNVAPQSMEQ